LNNISQVIEILKRDLNFNNTDIEKLIIFHDEVLKFNKKYNLIAKSTEKTLWNRHILDSAQLVNYINFNRDGSLSDLGTGAGFPGIVLGIFNKNPKFHVKLYEKSNVKCDFLKNVIKILNIKCNLYENDYHSHEIDSDYIVSRAFKKLDESIKISREIAKKPHKLIILKGKSAQEEIKKVSKLMIYKYRLMNSMTDKESKILIVEVN
tara:strand:+ start:1483 stop:2103 length:621 start_codon:yes stop_codon:yes gene_type:complete